MRRTFCKALAASLWAGAMVTPTRAQDAGKAARDLALYQGADRHDKLLELARREAELSIYHVYPALPAVVAAFTKRYGLKAKVWRSGSEAVLQRVISESRGNRFEVDVIQNNAPENEAAWREKLLMEAWSPHLKDLLPAAAPAHRGWAGLAIDVWTLAYHTGKVRKEDLPRSYQDLLEPRWKGMLGIEAQNHGWFGTLLGELGEEKGRRLFDQLMATNGLSARKGHSVLANLVASGDIPAGLTVYSWIPEQLKKKGAPIENHVLQPLLGQPSTLGIHRRAPNPASALLFLDFMLGEGQKVMAEASFVPASRLHAGPWAQVPLKMVDPVQVLDQQERWIKLFDDTIVKKAR